MFRLPLMPRRLSACLIVLSLALLLCNWPARAKQGGAAQKSEKHEPHLHVVTEGSGRPLVVFESGFGGTTETWAKVQPEVSKFARTFSYDRAGLGQSEAGPKPRTAARIARELHAALKEANAAPPYVFVSHSAGGAYVRVYAHMYPREVAGLLLIVPPLEGLSDWLKAKHPEAYGMPAERLATLPEGMQAEWQARDAVIEEMRGAFPLPRVPVVLLTSENDDAELASEVSPDALKVLEAARKSWMGRVPGARQVVAHKSGHNVPQQEPELVIETIRQVLAGASKSHTGQYHPR